MKPIVIFNLIFIFIVNESIGQNLNVVRNLGKLNFADSADLVLSAKVESGKYTYELTNIKSPEIPVFSFSLISNSVDAFKASIKSKISESGKAINVADSTLGKYFFYFENQNPFLVSDTSGGVAMEMVFSDELTVYNFKHNDFTNIKQSDIIELLNNLLKTVIPKQKQDSIFSFSMYEMLFIEIDNDSKYLFKNGFEARLQEIKNGSPKSLRLEQLYREIQYRYYKTLICHIESVVSEMRNSSKQSIREIQERITFLKDQKGNWVRDTTVFKNKILEKIVNIDDARLKIARLNERIQSPLILSDLTDTTILEDQSLWANFDSKFESNIRDSNTLRGRVAIERMAIENYEGLDSSKLEQLYVADLTKVQQKISDIRESRLENNRLLEFENSISQYQNLLISVADSLATVQVELSSNIGDIKLLQDSVLKVIKRELNALSNSNKYMFKARNLQLEFNRGYLENIVVVGEASIFIEPELAEYKLEIPLPETTLKFVNDYPLGISAKRDIERLGEIKLYARYEDDSHYELRLGDLIINIKEILALDRTDYSPKDGVVSIDLLSEKKKEFKKSDTKEILQLKVFSDFVGLQEENPNGLIQFEIDKEIPLVTKRVTRPYVWVPLRFIVNRNGNLGFLNFVRPRFVYSKIEDNNRFLELKSFPVSIDSSSTESSNRYGTSTLEIKQFERFSIGTDLNLLLYNIPYGKSTFLINAGMYFGRTDLATNDAVPESSELPMAYTNSYQPSLELMWRITGDERYGLELSYGVTWLISDQQNFTQRADTFGFDDFESFQASDKKYGIQRFMILAYLNLDPNTSGRLFFRYRSNSEVWDFKNNYSQLQIGYTTYLTKKSQ